MTPQDGFLLLDKSKFAASFAADVSRDTAAFMANSQVPWGVDALGGAVSDPAWKSKPSWYLVATDDKMIPPPAQRLMSKRASATVVETGGSHAVYRAGSLKIGSEDGALLTLTMCGPTARRVAEWIEIEARTSREAAQPGSKMSPR